MIRWETGNNIVAEEEGFLKGLGPDPDNVGEQIQAQVQHGSYSYTSPEGQLITVHYTADEFGFRPTGDHLPTPPPVSPEVQKGLDLIYAGIKSQQVCIFLVINKKFSTALATATASAALAIQLLQKLQPLKLLQ